MGIFIVVVVCSAASLSKQIRGMTEYIFGALLKLKFLNTYGDYNFGLKLAQPE